MASYTRQSSFSDGDTISASLFNNEYNQLVTAFSYSSSGTTGHRHDGTAAEGGNIHTIGDQDFLNKIVVDSSNNRWGVYVQVSGAAVEQIRFQDGSIVPVTSNDIDLGTSSLQFKDLHIDGTANIDSLTLTSGSTVTVILDEDDLTTNSATALATQQSIKAYVDSQVTGQALSFSGDSGGSLSIDLDSEALTITGGTGIDTTGSTNDMSIAIDSTVATLTGSQTLTNKTLTSPDINGGTIDGATIGGSSAGDITYANLSDGTITITAFADEDDMTSNSATLVPTQQSVKAYVDSKVTAEDLDFQADSGGALSIDLDSETMTFTGGTGIDTSGSGNAVTFAIDSTVTTLAGTQTLTNKTLTTPVITSISNSGTVTLPSGTTTLVGTATSDVLTNKTISGSSNTLSNIGNSSLSNSSVSFGGISVALGSSDATPAFDLSDATGYTGDSSLVTTGTISSGVWQGTAVADTYVANDLTISGGTVNNTVIGGSSPAAADFTTVDTTGNATIGGNLAVTGNLTINGTTSTVNSTTVTIDDPIFTLGGDTTPSTDDNKDRGIEFKWHNGTGAKLGFFGYDDSASVFTFIPDASNTSEVFSGSAGNVAFGAISGTSFASTGNMTFGDNDKAIFGAGSDLSIYSDGSTGKVDGNVDVTGTVTADGGDFSGQVQFNGTSGIQLDNAAQAHTWTLDDNFTSRLNIGTSSGSATWKIGSNNNAYLTVSPTGIDVTGTVTTDGLTSAGDAAITGSSSGSTVLTLTSNALADTPLMVFQRTGGAVAGKLAYEDTNTAMSFGTTTGHELKLLANNTRAIQVDSGGDISFYEDTGTTPKFFWDASAESLGIGTSSAAAKIHIQNDSDTDYTAANFCTAPSAIISNTTSGALNYASLLFSTEANGEFSIGSVQNSGNTASDFVFASRASGTRTERMRIDSDGQILSTANEPTVTLKCSDTSLGADQYIGGFKFEKTDGSGAGAGVVGGMRMRSEGGVGESTYLQFSTSSSSANDAERMRISSEGHVGIGTTNPTVGKLQVNDSSGGIVAITRTSGATSGNLGVIRFGNLDFDSNVANITAIQDGSKTSSALTFETQSTGGATAERMRILSSGGITFNGDTASANALDDYEEGTWTPAFGAETSNPTIGYNQQVGTYTKVGRLVTVIGYIITTSRSGGSGTLTIDGLPFTVSSTVPLGSIAIGFNFNWNTPPLNGGAQGSTNHILLYQDGRTNATSTPADIVASGNSYFYFSCTYYV